MTILSLLGILAGAALFGWAAVRLIRRWLVVRVRMPLIRRFRYHPKRPKPGCYIVPEGD